MAKKKETFGKPCGLLLGDIVMCWGIAPHRFYTVTKVEPRLGDNDLVYLTFLLGTSSAPLYTMEKTLTLDASHAVRVTAKNVSMHILRCSNDIQTFISVLEKQQDLEKERRECPLREVKKKSKGSATK